MELLKTETMTHLVSWGPDPVLEKKITGRLFMQDEHIATLATHRQRNFSSTTRG